VHHELLRVLWGKAVRKFGYVPPTRSIVTVLESAQPRQRRELEQLLVHRRGARNVDEVDWPIVDIRPAVNVECELIKYLVKDAEREGDVLALIDPTLFAGIYRGLEKVRAIVTSRNFWPKGDAGRHCECGCTLTRTQIVRPETEPHGGSESR
jgi:hypothetical protein